MSHNAPPPPQQPCMLHESMSTAGVKVPLT